jgi:hypothetical protein
MKWFLVVAALALCAAASATAATPAAAVSAPLRADVSAVTCSAVPAAYRSSSIKLALWVASCTVCKRLGPRQMARGAQLRSSDPPYVARWYAAKYVQTQGFRAIAARVGGAAVARPIIRNGCLAGFNARGRP